MRQSRVSAKKKIVASSIHPYLAGSNNFSTSTRDISSLLSYFLFKLYVGLFGCCLIFLIFNVSQIYRTPFVNHHVVSSCTETHSITDNPVLQCSTRTAIPSLALPNISTTAAVMPSQFDYSAWGEHNSIEKETEFQGWSKSCFTTIVGDCCRFSVDG
jgi:hypothetical protein